MKLLIYSFILLVCQSAFSQSDDSMNQIKKLQTERDQVNAAFDKLRSKEAASNSKMEKLNNSFNAMLVNLDSLTGISIALEKKTKRTAHEQQKLSKIKKQQNDMKTSLLEMEEKLMTLQNQHDQMKLDVSAMKSRLSQLDKQIQELKKRRQ